MFNESWQFSPQGIFHNDSFGQLSPFKHLKKYIIMFHMINILQNILGSILPLPGSLFHTGYKIGIMKSPRRLSGFSPMDDRSGSLHQRRIHSGAGPGWLEHPPAKTRGVGTSSNQMADFQLIHLIHLMRVWKFWDITNSGNFQVSC